MAAEPLLLHTAAATTGAAGRRVDRLFVMLALATIVCSGTWLATPAIVLVGVVGVARLAAGRPIATGWMLLAAAPAGYLLLGVANGQIGSFDDLRAATTTDFRVVGVIPILLFMATQRQRPDDARRTLSSLLGGVAVGLALSLSTSVLTGVNGNLPFSSHHAVGFAGAVVAVAVIALPADLVDHRRVILLTAAVAILASGSRSGLVAAAAGLVAIPLFRLAMAQRSGWTVGRALRVALVSLLVAAAAGVVAPRSVERFTSTIGSVVDGGLNAAAFGRPSDSGAGVSVADRNVAVRLSVWEQLAAEAGPTAVVRADAGTVDDLLSDVAPGETTHRVFSAHNFYLQLVVELGWIGMLAYVVASTVGIRLLMRDRMPATRVAIGALWVAVLVFGLTSNSLLSPAVMVPAAFVIQLLSADPERGRS